jgi:hypothetical protein
MKHRFSAWPTSLEADPVQTRTGTAAAVSPRCQTGVFVDAFFLSELPGLPRAAVGFGEKK